MVDSGRQIMGTQAVVSVRQDDNVVMKLVAGCNGVQTRTLADAIRRLGRVPTFLEASVIARDAHYGCDACFVVVTPGMVFISNVDAYERPEEYDNPNGFESYFRTLNDPNWNPRWANGTATHVEIVDF
jgi:hypothetical protein